MLHRFRQLLLPHLQGLRDRVCARSLLRRTRASKITADKTNSEDRSRLLAIRDPGFQVSGSVLFVARLELNLRILLKGVLLVKRCSEASCCPIISSRAKHKPALNAFKGAYWEQFGHARPHAYGVARSEASQKHAK